MPTWRCIPKRAWWEPERAWWNPLRDWWFAGPAQDAPFFTRLAARLDFEWADLKNSWRFRRYRCSLVWQARPFGRAYRYAYVAEMEQYHSGRHNAAVAKVAERSRSVASRNEPQSLTDLPVTDLELPSSAALN